MATRIAFSGGESILVAEELADVVKALEGHAADTPALPSFTRKAGYSDPGTVEGAPVHVRPAAILYVTNA
jgi:SpoU rRNA methylase family enzyme